MRRRLLLSRMVIDHRVAAGDPFRLAENAAQRAITDHLLGDRAVGMAEVGELLVGGVGCCDTVRGSKNIIRTQRENTDEGRRPG